MRRSAQAFIRDTLGRRGLTVRDIEIDVDWNHSDVILRRRAIGHEWAGNKSIGNALPVSVVIRGSSDERRVERAVTRFVETAIALAARQEAIAPFLDGDVQPAWSILMEPCALGIVRRAGWADRDMLEFHRPQAQQYTVGDNGYNVGTDLEPRTVDGHVLRISRMGLSGGVLRPGCVRLGADEGAGTYRGARTSCVEVAGGPVPETMRSAVVGRRIDEVVEHPAIAGCGARVTSIRHAPAQNSEGVLTMNLARRLVPMAVAPEGVDTSWLDVIASN